MFNVGLGEILLILTVALVFWGPGALPEIGRNLGKFVRKMREFAREMRANLGDAGSELEELHETVEQIRNPIAAFARELVADAPDPRRFAAPVSAPASTAAAGANDTRPVHPVPEAKIAGAGGAPDTVEADYARPGESESDGSSPGTGGVSPGTGGVSPDTGRVSPDTGRVSPGAGIAGGEPKRRVDKLDDYLGGGE